MKKVSLRTVSLTLTLTMVLLCMIPLQVVATDVIPAEVIPVDGGYLTVRITDVPNSENSRATQSVEKNVSVKFDNLFGQCQWIVALTASFAYNGFTCVCGYAVEDYIIYNDNWSVTYQDSSFVGRTATANFTVTKKLLGVTVETKEVMIQISCDENGYISFHTD